jgi:hypothetical protein
MEKNHEINQVRVARIANKSHDILWVIKKREVSYDRSKVKNNYITSRFIHLPKVYLSTLSTAESSHIGQVSNGSMTNE